jgi:ADP-ribosylglycohydrolase
VTPLALQDHLFGDFMAMIYSHFDLSECILGSLLGGALGDAFGAFYEKKIGIPSDIDDNPWLTTDDTVLSLATCEAVIEKGAIEPGAIAEHFVTWFREGKIRGIGASTYKSLTDLCAGAHWALAGCRGERAAGNGAAMRIAPLAFWLNPSEPKERQIIRDVCRVTHHNDEAYVGALAILIAIQTAAKGKWEKHGLLRTIIEIIPDCLLRDRVCELNRSFADASLMEISRKFGCSGWVVESVPLALAAAEHFPILGYQKMMQEVVSCGGDTDTIASMAGNITGAFLGQAGLPECWLNRLSERDLVIDIAGRFSRTVIEHNGETK